MEVMKISWDSGLECTAVDEVECAYLKDNTPEIHFSKEPFNKIRFMLKKYEDMEWLAGMVYDTESFSNRVDRRMI